MWVVTFDFVVLLFGFAVPVADLGLFIVVPDNGCALIFVVGLAGVGDGWF